MVQTFAQSKSKPTLLLQGSYVPAASTKGTAFVTDCPLN